MAVLTWVDENETLNLGIFLDLGWCSVCLGALSFTELSGNIDLILSSYFGQSREFLGMFEKMKMKTASWI